MTDDTTDMSSAEVQLRRAGLSIDAPTPDLGPWPEPEPLTCVHCGQVTAYEEIPADWRCGVCGCGWLADGRLHDRPDACARGAWWGPLAVAG